MAEELRAETSLKRVSQLNITKDEAKALKRLRHDNDRVIFTADKSLVVVVLDRRRLLQQTYGPFDEKGHI